MLQRSVREAQRNYGQALRPRLYGPGAAGVPVMLAHVRRWKSDRHFFARARRLFNIADISHSACALDADRSAAPKAAATGVESAALSAGGRDAVSGAGSSAAATGDGNAVAGRNGSGERSYGSAHARGELRLFCLTPRARGRTPAGFAAREERDLL